MYVIIYRYDVDPAQRERFMRQRGDDYHARNATTRDLYRDEWQIAALEVPADPLTRRSSAHPGQRLSGGPS